ncbi:hypothetical protein SAMN05192565_107141 [Methylobacterium gossipiicola]|uniref:Uncharacterized protein n=1 Tax=Methylobacterium gossipiicola TaxID=582675 RepID=A0A1I2TNC7_9HYPH|nr:hypothetical protein SAMN05192565_107141 [Methylobacterium gossipiicola]
MSDPQSYLVIGWALGALALGFGVTWLARRAH